MESLKPGMIVTIYVRPDVEKDEIGEAKLIERHYTGGGIEFWDVEYIGRPGEIYGQFVKTPETDPTYTDHYKTGVKGEFDLDNWIAKQLM